jgi:hypothetical protein
MAQKKRFGLLSIVALSIFTLYFHYQPYLTDPDNSFFNLYGDGYKNYYTVYYHVKHDANYSHFEGMNYPHGEHVMYTDGQPALANTLKFISRNVVDISDHTVAIMNLSIIFSFLLCALLLYLILVRLQVAPWFAVIAALGIMLMSPQHFRPIGHYSLSYGFVFPLMLYLLLRFEEKPNFRLSVLIGALIWFLGLLHMYYLGIVGMMIAWYFLFTFLQKRTLAEALRLGMHYAIQVVIPFALIQIWVLSTDSVTDRPKTPVGFLDYRAYWEGIVTAVQLPHWAWVDQHLVDIRSMTFESETYIGLVGVVGFLCFLPLFLRRKVNLPGTGVAPRFLSLLFPSILIMLLISMGLPFIIPGFGFLIDYLGPFRQFRGQGRFAWAFYYGWSIILWYLIYHIGQSWKPVRRGLLFVVAFLVLSLEGYFMSRASMIKPWKDPTRYSKKEFESGPNYWFKNSPLLDYQAILPMPYFHVGSENFAIEAPGDAVRFATLGGWHYGMNNLGVEMSRSSYSQTLKLIPLDLLPYRPYAIVKDLPNNKPLLAVLDKAQYFSVPQGSNYLLHFGKLLYEDTMVQVREIPLDAFDLAVEAWRKDIKVGYEGTLQKGVQRNGFLLPDSSYQYYYRTFDELKSPRKYQGKGAFVGRGRHKAPFLTFKAPAAYNEVSVWVYLGEEQRPRMNFKGFEVDAAGKENLVVHNACKYDIQALDNNGWGLIVFPMKVSAPGATVRMELECPEMTVKELYVDEFLVRQAGTPQDNMFWRKGNYLIYNNLWFPNMY